MRKILLATAAGFAALVADGATPARAQSAAEVSGQTPQPGLTGYVQGRFRFYGAIISQDGRTADNGTKLTNYDFNTLGRIWVGADGVAANGLRYGARLEIRLPGSGASTDARGNLFFRRVTGYLGTPTLGQLRFGTGTVMAVEQMHTGHILGGIATGTLDGDFPGFLYSGGGGFTASSFWYSSSVVNSPTAIGYYTPQFFGFDAGISFAPNDQSFLGNCGGALADCDRIATVATGNANRLRNIIDAMLRYRGTFGPVGITASGGLRTATTTSAVGTAVAHKDPTVGIVGTQITFAGLTVGGLATFGNSNRGFAALPSAGSTKKMFGWQLGARYTIGALTVGAAYHQLRSEGSTAGALQNVPLRERAFTVGGTYTLAPGLALFAEYIHSRVRESGRDFDSNKAGVQDKFTAQGVLLGVGVQW
ncbi:porin [Elioraea sp.]|uniref:porin n=1 Tax=Elioraea sp. TaxID=2185103 RepID=UPI003F708487